MDFIEEAHKKYGQHEQYVSAKTVAEHLSLNIWTVYKLAQRGQIPSHKFGKARRFKLSEIDSS